MTTAKKITTHIPEDLLERAQKVTGEGIDAKDTMLVKRAAKDGILILIPPVLSELLSDPGLPKNIEEVLLDLPTQEMKEGYWVRVAHLRRKVLKKKRKAKLTDSLICQFCLDHNLSLITRDSDFNNFKDVSPLVLL